MRRKSQSVEEIGLGSFFIPFPSTPDSQLAHVIPPMLRKALYDAAKSLCMFDRALIDRNNFTFIADIVNNGLGLLSNLIL